MITNSHNKQHSKRKSNQPEITNQNKHWKNNSTQQLKARIDELRERINYPRQTIQDRIEHARQQLDPEPDTTQQQPQEPKPTKPSLADLKNKLKP